METTVPFHPGFLLGRSVNMKTLKPGYMIVGEENYPISKKVNQITSHFSFATSMKDVCDVFNYPPEYALKVKAGIVENEMLNQCLKNLGKTDLFTVIFRTTFLEQKQYLHQNIAEAVFTDCSTNQVDSEEEHCIRKSLTSQAVTNSSLNMHDLSTLLIRKHPVKRRSHQGTHWVKAVEIGNELITVMTISCKDKEKLNKLKIKFCECLHAYCGKLDITKMQALHKVAVKIDKKLSQKHNGDVILDIFYCLFNELNKYPASISGMVKTLESFMNQCIAWDKKIKNGLQCEVESCTMRCVLGTDKEKTLVQNSLKSMLLNFSASVHGQEDAAFIPSRKTEKEAEETKVHGESESFVVLDSSGSLFCYKLRVTLHSLKEAKDVPGSLALSQVPEITNTVFDKLFKHLGNFEEALHLLQDFLMQKHFIHETYNKQSRQVLESIQNDHFVLLENVAGLDFMSFPTESEITLDPISKVTFFIENATSKLPPGSDIDLLMLGKTGNGKSATGNSIVGKHRFATSGDMESMTSSCDVVWSETDGRTIKVVDTPGVCDTKFLNHEASIELAIKSFSEAISFCPMGFHAFLLVIRFGVRFTDEEKKAIHLFKSVLGDDIFRSHCICVITHGDILEKEIEEKKINFETWCKNKTGFLKDLFEECNYRCVIFNNNTTDQKVKKAQLMRLVSMVDNLKDNGIRYTNDLFKYAQKECERIVSRENVPQVNEDMMKDIQLIIEQLNSIENKSNEAMKYREEFSKLMQRVDNLKSRVSESEKLQLGLLVDIIFDLSTSLHSNIEEIANQCKPKNLNDLVKHKERLEKYYNMEVSPKKSMITKKVVEQVKPKVEERECFPGNSMVTLSSGKSIPLEKLQVGDKVLVRNNAGHLSYDTVYMFGHKEFKTSSEFIAMKAGSYTVYVTAEHYVYCIKHEKEVCVAAKNVQVGDCLLVVTSEGLMPQSVETITFERKRGLFAPFTNSGCIIIDGVLMSCYINVLSHTTCHNLLWPVRQLYLISPCMLSCINGSSFQYPVPRLAKAALKLM